MGACSSWPSVTPTVSRRQFSRDLISYFCVRACVCVLRISVDIPQVHTLSHRLRLILNTKPWNLSSLPLCCSSFLSFSHPPSCLFLSRLFPFAASGLSFTSRNFLLPYRRWWNIQLCSHHFFGLNVCVFLLHRLLQI